MSPQRRSFSDEAAAADSAVAAAASWCLERFVTAPAGVHVRAAGVADSDTLLRMEANAFSMFDRPDTPARMLPLTCPNGTLQSFGYLVKVVACTDRGIGAYLIAQVRNWGEVYLCEVVAKPLHADQRIRSAGALLLGTVARMAGQLGHSHLTAQVRRLDLYQPTPGYCSARIIAHDTRHGLLPTGDQGVLADGRLSHIDDAWLRGRPDDILQILLRKFGGAEPAGS